MVHGDYFNLLTPTFSRLPLDLQYEYHVFKYSVLESFVFECSFFVPDNNPINLLCFFFIISKLTVTKAIFFNSRMGTKN